MTSTSRHRGAAVALAAGLVVGSVACRPQGAEEVETTSAAPVKTAPATRAAIRGLVHATGLVVPAPGAELVVVAPEPARISAIPYANGERVRKGAVLVRFDIPASAADERKAQAGVTRAAATLESAKAAQVRARELFHRGVAARKDVEEADRAAADAEAAVAESRASLAAAQAVAGRATVRATFDGVVAKRYHNPGDFVEAAAGDPVLRVVDPGRIEVVASVPLADASRVEVGAAAHLSGGVADASQARLAVRSRPIAVEEGTATVPVRLGFARPVDIPVGTPVEVAIDAEDHRNAILVPVAAIVREGDETAVFVASEGKARRRIVRVGLVDGTDAEILAGVSAGERVIVDGQAGLPDGAPITESRDVGGPESGRGGTR